MVALDFKLIFQVKLTYVKNKLLAFFVLKRETLFYDFILTQQRQMYSKFQNCIILCIIISIFVKLGVHIYDW